jgi:hypothetical protein
MIIDSLFAIVVSSNFVVAITDSVPRYDVAASCRGAAQQLDGRIGRDASNQSVSDRAANCMKTEEDARAKLVAVWSVFNSAERSHCVGSSSSGGRPSYVELLVCLEIKQEIRKIRSQPGATTPSNR